MRSLVAAVLLLAAALAASAQSPVARCASPESHQLDFWVGEWNLAYMQDGKAATSRNRITKTLDGCAILEEFDGAPGNPLVGRSMSMYDARAKLWKQVWVDNSGAWLDFTGGLEDGRMVFARDAERDGRRFRQRMVFDDVTRDALTWRWQRSDDAGRTWKTLWEIAYRRTP